MKEQTRNLSKYLNLLYQTARLKIYTNLRIIVLVKEKINTSRIKLLSFLSDKEDVKEMLNPFRVF